MTTPVELEDDDLRMFTAVHVPESIPKHRAASIVLEIKLSWMGYKPAAVGLCRGPTIWIHGSDRQLLNLYLQGGGDIENIWAYSDNVSNRPLVMRYSPEIRQHFGGPLCVTVATIHAGTVLRTRFCPSSPLLLPSVLTIARMDAASSDPGSQEPAIPPVTLVRAYRKRAALSVPDIPIPPPDAAAYRAPGAAPALASELTQSDPDSFSHIQPRIRQPRRDAEQKAADESEARFTAMNDFPANLEPFSSLGDFLATLFYDHAHGQTDPRGLTHAKAAARFLRGSTDIRMSHILPLIYKHRNSYPSVSSSRPEEQTKMFCTEALGWSNDNSDWVGARPKIWGIEMRIVVVLIEGKNSTTQDVLSVEDERNEVFLDRPQTVLPLSKQVKTLKSLQHYALILGWSENTWKHLK
ncbi:hypothetical protein B0H10DRAFT_1946222 [Mycena sp. CBHHK59/15]|nr:hypothetical protein B0H10DRAFT_1946222 [Mycena sp. CBHHK59/15]